MAAVCPRHLATRDSAILRGSAATVWRGTHAPRFSHAHGSRPTIGLNVVGRELPLTVGPSSGDGYNGPVGVPSANGKQREMTGLHGNDNPQLTE